MGDIPMRADDPKAHTATPRQLEIVQNLIDRSPVGLTIERIEQTGDSPSSHTITLLCQCNAEIDIVFNEGEEGFWTMTALNTIRSHVEAKHGESLTAGV
jgi:hypothetical protein